MKKEEVQHLVASQILEAVFVEYIDVLLQLIWQVIHETGQFSMDLNYERVWNMSI